jgi:hypothetical protein
MTAMNGKANFHKFPIPKYLKKYIPARFQIFMAVKIQVEIFWVVTLKTEAARSYCNTTWYHNPEDSYLK